MQPSNENTEIPRGLQLSLNDDLSLLFSDYYVKYVKYSANVQLMKKIPWADAHCHLLREVYDEELFTTAMGFDTQNLVLGWSSASISKHIRNFLLQLREMELLTQTWEVMSAHGLFAPQEPMHFLCTFMQAWFGVYDWEQINDGRSLRCGFRHVFLGERDVKIVHGLHYWGKYYHEEKISEITFIKTHRKHPRFPLASIQFLMGGAKKPYGTIFFACPTELEILIFFSAFMMGQPVSEFFIDAHLFRVRCIYRPENPREILTTYFQY